MFSKYLKFSGLVAIGSLACFSLIAGCKNAGPVRPYDVPVATSTATNTPTMVNSPTATFTLTATPTVTITPTPGPVNVSCYVTYNGNQSGLSWNLVDPNGNTVNQTTQSTGGTPFLFTPSVFGTYSVNIPTQTNYLYSSQPLTIRGSGNYSVTFTCSGQTLSTNPASFNYSSAIGYQTPVTVSYSYSGNLDVPVSVQTSGLDSSFSVLPSYVILNNSGSSGFLNVSKNICDTNNTSLGFAAYRLLGGSTVATSNISINKGYSIPVNFYYSYSGAVTQAGLGSFINTSGAVTYTISCTDSSLSCSVTPYSISYGQLALSPYGVNYGSSGSGSFGQGSSATFSFNWNYATGTSGLLSTLSMPITATLPNSSQVTGNISFSYNTTGAINNFGTLFGAGSY